MKILRLNHFYAPCSQDQKHVPCSFFQIFAPYKTTPSDCFLLFCIVLQIDQRNNVAMGKNQIQYRLNFISPFLGTIFENLVPQNTVMLHYRYLDCGTLILISNCLHYFSKVCRFLYHLNFTPNLSYFCKNRGFSPSIPPTFTAVMRLFIIRAWYALFHNSQFEINRFHRSLSSSIG